MQDLLVEISDGEVDDHGYTQWPAVDGQQDVKHLVVVRAKSIVNHGMKPINYNKGITVIN